MNRLVDWALPLGAALDAILGDPKGWPHPVRALGGLITRTERVLRALVHRLRGGPRAETVAGGVLAVLVVGLTALAAWGVVVACDRMGEAASLIGQALLIYWGLAARGLGVEALRVAEAPDLPAARRELAQIVGRDTHTLDWPEVHRACVETVAENTNDAIVAPLFWFVLGGPVGLWMYKAISTLDSMVGYRNPCYQHLGWAAARLDDLAALVPARLTWVLIAWAAALTGERADAALRVGWRDARKHTSPNAAWGQAAMAGALGVQLGGTATYGGVIAIKPRLGDHPDTPITRDTVHRAVRLMALAALIAIVLAWLARLAVTF